MEFINEAIVGCSVLVASILSGIVKKFVSDERFYPLISIALGLMFGIAFLVKGDVDVPTFIISGIVCGLTASGLYSNLKALK